MTTVVKPRLPIVIPRSVQRLAGIKTGDQLEFRVAGSTILILPKLANDDYTPAQRRAIDARLAEADKGPFHGPFENMDQLTAYLKTYKRRRSVALKAKPTG